MLKAAVIKLINVWDQSQTDYNSPLVFICSPEIHLPKYWRCFLQTQRVLLYTDHWRYLEKQGEKQSVQLHSEQMMKHEKYAGSHSGITTQTEVKGRNLEGRQTGVVITGSRENLKNKFQIQWSSNAIQRGQFASNICEMASKEQKQKKRRENEQLF